MTTSKIKDEIEKIRTLSTLKRNLCEDAFQGDNSEILMQRIIVTQEELLKSTYKINKILKDIEQKI